MSPKIDRKIYEKFFVLKVLLKSFNLKLNLIENKPKQNKLMHIKTKKVPVNLTIFRDYKASNKPVIVIIQDFFLLQKFI